MMSVYCVMNRHYIGMLGTLYKSQPWTKILLKRNCWTEGDHRLYIGATRYICSFLLASLIAFLLTLARNYFPQHDDTIAIHESNTRQSFAILECVTHKRLLWLEAALCHLV